MAKYKGTDAWNTPAADPKPLTQEFPQDSLPEAVPVEESPTVVAEPEPTPTVPFAEEETLKQRLVRYVSESNATMSKQTDDEVIYYGLVGETGEVIELLKKAIGQGHTIELPQLRKELGDVCWYVARVQERYGSKGEQHGIDPYIIIGPRKEMAKRLAQQVAGCTEEFMEEAAPNEVTDRCSRILSYLVGLYREVEISNLAEGESLADFQEHMEVTMKTVLEENKAKLEARFSSGKFSAEASLNRKEDDK